MYNVQCTILNIYKLCNIKTPSTRYNLFRLKLTKTLTSTKY